MEPGGEVPDDESPGRLRAECRPRDARARGRGTTPRPAGQGDRPPVRPEHLDQLPPGPHPRLRGLPGPPPQRHVRDRRDRGAPVPRPADDARAAARGGVVLRQLSERVGLSSYLGLLQEGRVTVVEVAEAPGRRTSRTSRSDSTSSAHATALGQGAAGGDDAARAAPVPHVPRAVAVHHPHPHRPRGARGRARRRRRGRSGRWSTASSGTASRAPPRWCPGVPPTTRRGRWSSRSPTRTCRRRLGRGGPRRRRPGRQLRLMASSLGIVFRPQSPPEELRATVELAERAGIAELWLWEDCFLEGGLTTAAAALAWSERLRVGVGLLPVPLRNPALAAMEIATLARLWPDRFVVTLGHGIQDWMAQVGARVESPMTLLREHASAVRRLLDGETVSVSGRYVNLDAVALDWPPARRPDLLIGARGPRTIRLAGEVADGVLLDTITDPAVVRRARGIVDEAREASGRDGRGLVCVYTGGGPDQGPGRPRGPGGRLGRRAGRTPVPTRSSSRARTSTRRLQHCSRRSGRARPRRPTPEPGPSRGWRAGRRARCRRLRCAPSPSATGRRGVRTRPGAAARGRRSSPAAWPT